MSETKVVHIKKQPYDVYIGRPSKWGNPFTTGSREQRIKRYKDYILQRRDLLDSLHELEGKVLGCWCKPKPCHGDVLVELIKGRRNNEE